jgi:hypothetical protein
LTQSCNMIAMMGYLDATGYGYDTFGISIEILQNSLILANQDPLHAHFSNCFLPHISAIPAAVAICILLVQALGLLLPRQCWPRWSEVFIKEPEEQPEEFEPKAKRPVGRLTAALLVASSVGFILQLLATFYPSFCSQAVFFAGAWVCSPLKS